MYNIGKLKNFVYLVEDLVFSENNNKINIVNADLKKLNCNLVTLNETENKTFLVNIVCSINDIILKIESRKYKLIIETTLGILYLASDNFLCNVSNLLNIVPGNLLSVITFSIESQIKEINNNVNSNTNFNTLACLYNPFNINLYINDGGWQKLNAFNINYTRTDTSTTILFSLLINEYKNYINNIWDIKLKVDNYEIIDYSLYPTYIRQTSEDFNNPNTVTYTFKSSNNLGFLELYRWVGTNETILENYKYYQKEVEQILDSDWTNTGKERKGIFIKEEIPTGTFTWKEEGTVCVGFNKYTKEVLYNDTGVKTGKERIGSLIEINSTSCGYTS